MLETENLNPKMTTDAELEERADETLIDPDTLRTWAEIDYDAIAHNVDEVQKLVGDTKIMGIVKANAYGLGAVQCARALEEAGVDFFAVATIDEAIELRQAGLNKPLLILGYTSPARAQQLLDYDLIQTIVSLEYAQDLSDFALSQQRQIRGHVKLDTGMNRTGILFQPQHKDQQQLLDVYRQPGLQIEGIFSHFPVSDDLEEESMSFTRRQISLFREALSLLEENGIHPGLRHIQNSYGILNYLDLGMDYCRPGLLYMGVTSDDAIPIVSEPDFIPIMELKTHVSMVKTIPAGATVSYGRHYKADQPRRIASLCIGYADGLPRACSNQNMSVLLHGKRAPIVGNICMDQCMVDVTEIPEVKQGDVAVLVGRDGEECITVDEITRHAGTINNETLTRLTARVPRIAKKQILQAKR